MQTATAPHLVPEAPPHLPRPKQRADLRPYRKEKTLFTIMAVISGFWWVLLTLFTFGTVWLFMLAMYVLGLVAFSYFISYVRGNGVRVTADQFPDLHARFEACCATVGMTERPEFYLLTGNGALNAFATRFLRRYYVVLYSDIVDALEDDPEALNFYIGHELGHIAQKHLVHHWWLVFARGMPLLATAYSRAREYTCDQYGLLCTNNNRSAVRALAVLAAGGRRWKNMNTQAYVAQAAQTDGFWMALNELTAPYPWLCKRVARVEQGDDAKFPRRSFWAWLCATFVPNTGFGLIGAVVIYAYLASLLVPLGIVAYSVHRDNAKVAAARAAQAPTREQLGKAQEVGMAAGALVFESFKKNDELPRSLDEVGFKNPNPALVKAVTFDADEEAITIELNAPLDDKTLKLSFSRGEEEEASWSCVVTGNVVTAALPEGCSSPDAEAAEEAEKSAPSLLDKILSRVER